MRGRLRENRRKEKNNDPSGVLKCPTRSAPPELWARSARPQKWLGDGRAHPPSKRWPNSHPMRSQSSETMDELRPSSCGPILTDVGQLADSGQIRSSTQPIPNQFRPSSVGVWPHAVDIGPSEVDPKGTWADDGRSRSSERVPTFWERPPKLATLLEVAE